MKLLLLLVAVVGFGSPSGQAQSVVPLSKDPAHSLKLENAYVRVYDVAVPPAGMTMFHVHDKDYFIVNFGNLNVRAVVQDQPGQDVKYGNGEVRYTPATLTHQMQNTDKTTFHNLTIELLKAPSGTAVPPGSLGRNQTVVLENRRIRAVRTMLQPGESTGMYSHPGHSIMVVIEDASIRTETPDGKSEERRMKAGEFTWTDAALTHSLWNSGKTVLHLVEVEIFP
jgi:quercetin dioxygenase-like cupin family protein